ncbi:hypothetical protein N7462_001746 [Penicillium macrosclerotiorum]|uniref:uncharacterized protein n=1 Tax=Penicillium macrosclerotiorum TaxID=303699 RepID=UPI002548A7F2|nr:uncharacterized protein N7462_001746 [Penicillium macrosclerotiorum]KAJ5692323.1 hypothetical protein N7462_001746 [Penicillium macrosclerotiorum]
MVDTHQQNTALGVVVAFPILGGLAVILRLWSRRLSRSTLTSDDYLIVSGYILSVCQSVTSWYYIKTNYVGIHYWDIPKDHDVKKGLIWNFVNQLVYNPALTLTKVSILVFLRRLESRSRIVNILFWTSLVMVVGLFIAVLFVDIFQCNPVAYVYDTSIQGGTCIEQGSFYVSSAALNLFTDILVLSIPIIITWSLQMPLRRKIAVCIILCLGGVATAIGVWRIIILAQAFFSTTTSPDYTYSIGFCSSAIEVNVAVITACGPSMKAIATKYLPRLLGSSNGETSGYGAGTSGSRGRFPGSKIFSTRQASHLHSNADDGYEMADPAGGHRVEIGANSANAFDMRKYRRGGDSPSISSGSEDGVTGIVKTMDVSVKYTVGEVASTEDGRSDGRSRDGKHGSVDSLV